MTTPAGENQHGSASQSVLESRYPTAEETLP
jgi:hypothetical protein